VRGLPVAHRSVGRKGQVKKRRYPKMDEIAQAKDELLDGGLNYVCTVPSLSETQELLDTQVDLYQFPPLDPDAPVPTEERRPSGLIVPA
jgi:hypothetical protein